MHRVWDTGTVEILGDDSGAIAAAIGAQLSPGQKTLWQSGTPAAWADESFLIARHEVYDHLAGYRRDGPPILLPRSYLAGEAPVVRAQLAKAGLRLAWLLNISFR
jgi:hypothetical protein